MLCQFLMYYKVVLLYIYTCILFHILFHYGSFGFPGGSDGKESACNAGDLGLIPGLERSPGEGHGNPLQYPWLENLHGQRSLAGSSTGSLRAGHD